MNENMRFYEKGRNVPQDAQKAFSNGRFSGTDINPMWRIKKLTEMFGPCGFGWYTEVVRQDHVVVDDGNVMVFVDINLYVKDGDAWSKPIFGTGGNTIKTKGKGDDEGYKKAYTDALGIACKALGIGADVWYSADVNSDPTSKYADDSNDDGRADGDDAGNICESCGKPITGWIDKNGNRFNASAVIKRAREKYNGCFCAECMTRIAATAKKKAG